jgi:hypothetical protein
MPAFTSFCLPSTAILPIATARRDARAGRTALGQISP